MFDNDFLPRDAMRSAAYAVVRCQSFSCSHIVLKRVNIILKEIFYHMVAVSPPF